MPAAFQEFVGITKTLEKHYRDMQDIEFTVEDGKLWMLQTRSGKRTGKAALRIAVEMVKEGLISKEEAVARIDPASLDQLLHPTIDPKAERNVIARGLPASPGAASGEIVFSSEEAGSRQGGRQERDSGAPARPAPRTSTACMAASRHPHHARRHDLARRRGGARHGASPAFRAPAISASTSAAGTLIAGGKTFKKGDVITIDGSTGQVLAGKIAMVQPELSGEFGDLMVWADGVRRMKVRTNAETPPDARTARTFGAEGIGLCRTEHMFFDEDRIVAMREMILADDEKGRRAALAKLLPMQREDFRRAFRDHGRPAGDHPPARSAAARIPAAHGRRDRGSGGLDRSFTGETEGTRAGTARVQPDARLPRLPPRRRLPRDRRDAGPRHLRGGRGGRASTGQPVTPEIMVPLVATRAELDIVKARIDAMAKAVEKERGVKLVYQVGTMIELPRAAIRAGEIAESAEFFSFGTNDLTQTTIGISRDDAASFLGTYVQKGIFAVDPFVSIDQEGVGALVEIGAERGRKHAPGPQARHLRRAWRRSGFDHLLREGRARLRVLLALPRADRQAGGGAGGAGEAGESRPATAGSITGPLCNGLRHHMRMQADHAHIGNGEIGRGHPRLFPIAQRTDRNPEAIGELGLREPKRSPCLADQSGALTPL